MAENTKSKTATSGTNRITRVGVPLKYRRCNLPLSLQRRKNSLQLLYPGTKQELRWPGSYLWGIIPECIRSFYLRTISYDTISYRNSGSRRIGKYFCSSQIFNTCWLWFYRLFHWFPICCTKWYSYLSNSTNQFTTFWWFTFADADIANRKFGCSVPFQWAYFAHLLCHLLRLDLQSCSRL